MRVLISSTPVTTGSCSISQPYGALLLIYISVIDSPFHLHSGYPAGSKKISNNKFCKESYCSLTYKVPFAIHHQKPIILVPEHGKPSSAQRPLVPYRTKSATRSLPPSGSRILLTLQPSSQLPPAPFHLRYPTQNHSNSGLEPLLTPVPTWFDVSISPFYALLTGSCAAEMLCPRFLSGSGSTDGWLRGRYL